MLGKMGLCARLGLLAGRTIEKRVLSYGSGNFWGSSIRYMSSTTSTNAANTSSTNVTDGSSAINKTTTPAVTDQLKYLKFDSIGSNNLYAILRLHNIPYLVTKGDKIILPTKMKGVQVGDQLDVNKVTTLGTTNFTYNDESGISPDLYTLKASVVEITREPYYEVYRTKRRNRRIKTFPVENFQTVLRINELSLN